MVAQVHQEVEAGSVVACLLGMWHFRDAPVEIKLGGYTDRCRDHHDFAQKVGTGNQYLPNPLRADEMSFSQKAPMHKARTSSNSYLSENSLRETSLVNTLTQF